MKFQKESGYAFFRERSQTIRVGHIHTVTGYVTEVVFAFATVVFLSPVLILTLSINRVQDVI